VGEQQEMRRASIKVRSIDAQQRDSIKLMDVIIIIITS